MKNILYLFVFSTLYFFGEESFCQKSDRIFRVVISQIPKKLDPQQNEIDSNKISKQVFESLVSFDPAGNPEPSLAIRWTIDREKKCVTFVVDTTKKFSDGSQLKIEDVQYSLQRSFNKGSFLKQLVNNTGFCQNQTCSFMKTDKSKITLFLKKHTYELFLKVMAASVSSIIKEKSGEFIGTGPFIVEFHDSKTVLLKRKIFDPKLINTITYIKALPDEAKKMFLQGQVHELWNQRLEPQSIQDSEKNVQKVEFAFYGTYQFVFSMESKFFKEKKVREAVSISIDPKKIIDLLSRDGVPAASYMPKGVMGHLEDPPILDIEQAKENIRQYLSTQKVDATKFGSLSNDVRLAIHKSYSTKKRFITYLKNTFEEIGLSLNIKFMEFSAALTAMKTGEADFILKADSIQYYDPSTIYITLMKGNFSNISDFDDPLFEKCVQASFTAVSEEEKEEYLKKAERRLKEQFAIKPLFYPKRTSYYSSRVKTTFRAKNELLYWEFPYKNFAWEDTP